MSRRFEALRGAGLALALGLALPSAAAPVAGSTSGGAEAAPGEAPPATSLTSPPNVILIMTDDQGWGDLRSHGNDAIETPVMDGLAAAGVTFDHFYVDPVCAPTRASLLTGRYALRAGVTGVTRGRETMRADEITLAEMLRAAGYATGCFGKWHSGSHYPNHPNGQGFDEFFGFCGGHINDYFDPHLEHNGEPVQVKGYVTDVLTDHAIEFIRGHRAQPFFCYLPYNAPHRPLQVPDAEYDHYRKRGLSEETSAIYGMLAKVDENVGRLLKTLDELQLAERTVVIFLSDNGPSTDRFNAGMKGIKANVNEGGTRVPFMIRWTGHLPAGRVVSQIAAHIDVVPTVTELCGVARPDSVKWDGVSLVATLRGAAELPPRSLFVHMPLEGKVRKGPGAVRTDRYRAVWLGQSDPWALYDMTTDPGQEHDIADAKADVVKQMRDEYEQWLAECTSRSIDRPPIPVGYAESPIVVLPAIECYMGGRLRYANQLGWAEDWATNWTDRKDDLEWDLDVVRGGRYEVVLMHTAPKEAVGTVLRVAAGTDTLRATLAKAFDPPAEKRHDRNPESTRLVKTFTPLAFGQIRLEKGRVRIALQAEQPKGKRIADVYSLRLRYVGE